MQLLKRIGLFIMTNLLIIALISIIVGIVNQVFGINLYGNDLISIGFYALIVGFLGAFISLAMSRWMAKRAYGITPITEQEALTLTGKEALVYGTVRDLSRQAGITMPEVGIYESAEPNAFATGMTKNRSLVAVSRGLLESMDSDALVGVIGHEMSHILNGDMVTMTLLQGVMNTFVVFLSRLAMIALRNTLDEKLGFLAEMLVYIVLQVILGALASLVVMGFSRHREYRADEGSARVVGKDKMLAALRSLEALYPRMAPTAEHEEMRAFAISAKDGSGIMKLFASHPDLRDRIRNLESQAL